MLVDGAPSDALMPFPKMSRLLSSSVERRMKQQFTAAWSLPLHWTAREWLARSWLPLVVSLKGCMPGSWISELLSRDEYGVAG
jgi:hypothetical protein